MSNATEPRVWLHVGLGSFHRAHQALYLHMLRETGDQEWSLAGGNVRPDMAETINALVEQQGEYTLETISPANEHNYIRITSIKEVIPFEPGVKPLIARAADPQTKIISFTVTEAGYYLDPKNVLDTEAADIANDLAAVKEGRAGTTIYGALAVMLKARKDANGGPVTLLCCDNLRHNGDRSRSGLKQFIQKLGDTDLLAWVEQNTTSPNDMVDRITPRPAPDVAERVLAATGQVDKAAVMGESFLQWVIEENFIAGRPAWEKVGVEMVTSVAAYEEAKIRLLNATHGCVAWAGALIGKQYIHEDVAAETIRKIAFDYVTNDVIPVLQPSPLDLAKYRDVVLERFSNPYVRDTNERVAMDGSSKIPGFIAPTIHDRLARNESIDSVAMLPALFVAFLKQHFAGNLKISYTDQLLGEDGIRAICLADDPVGMLCNNPVLWGNLAGDSRLYTAVQKAYMRIQDWLAGLRS
ncbi:MAG: mannitol dehydrogenase family protein [Propionivibrio sp.]